jgi:hypothetical protein
MDLSFPIAVIGKVALSTQSCYTFYFSKSRMLTKSRQIVGSDRYGTNRTYRNQCELLTLNASSDFNIARY